MGPIRTDVVSTKWKGLYCQFVTEGPHHPAAFHSSIAREGELRPEDDLSGVCRARSEACGPRPTEDRGVLWHVPAAFRAGSPLARLARRGARVLLHGRTSLLLSVVRASPSRPHWSRAAMIPYV